MEEERRLVDYIGEPALLEQMAEECNELAFACLKLARFLRGENKVHGRSVEDLKRNIEEEMADVSVALDELYSSGIVVPENVFRWESSKRERMMERLSKEGEVK